MADNEVTPHTDATVSWGTAAKRWLLGAFVNLRVTGDLTDGTNTTTVSALKAGLTDARTPTAHASSHGSGQADAITVAQSQVTDLSTALSAKADLVGGAVPASQLPSYVDDVLEYDDSGDFPETGESAKVYVAKDTNKTYRWGGSSYVEIGGGGVALGETESTAYRGDRGKAAYDHSLLTSGNPHGVTATDIGAATSSALTSHTGNTSNPHSVTAAQAGALATSLMTTRGDLLFRDASAAARLAAGTAGQRLVTEGSSADPKWIDPLAYHFNAASFDSPNSADWAVNAMATCEADATNAAVTVRAFDPTAEEGVGFGPLRIPAGAIGIKFTFRWHAATSPAATKGWTPKLYSRSSADGAAWGAWNAGAEFTTQQTADETWNIDQQSITLATLGYTAGDYRQFELTRNVAAAGDDLAYDVCLDTLILEFY